MPAPEVDFQSEGETVLPPSNPESLPTVDKGNDMAVPQAHSSSQSSVNDALESYVINKEDQHLHLEKVEATPEEQRQNQQSLLPATVEIESNMEAQSVQSCDHVKTNGDQPNHNDSGQQLHPEADQILRQVCILSPR